MRLPTRHLSRLRRSSGVFLSALACAAFAAFALALFGCTAAETATDTQAPPAQTAPEASGSSTGSAAADDPAANASGEPAAELQSDAYPLKLTPAIVTRIVDGDTAHFRLEDGTVEKVRFIGVNTPESTTRHEPYGDEASSYTKRQLPIGAKVWLETDAELRDRYGRLLAYVWMSRPTEADSDSRATRVQAENKMLNAWLMRDGFAQVMTIPPNVRYQDYFLELQDRARKADRGLWGLSSDVGGSSTGAAGDPGAASALGEKTGDSGYVGNRNSMKFHEGGCRWVREMSPANKVPFKTRTAALDAGYVPCKVCRP